MSRSTTTTRTLAMLNSTNISSGLTQALFLSTSTASASSGSVGRGLRRGFAIRFVNFRELRAVAPQGAGGKQGIVGGQHKIAACCGAGGLNRDKLRLDVVAAKQVQAFYVITRDKASNLIEHGIRIEGAEFGLDLS